MCSVHGDARVQQGHDEAARSGLAIGRHRAALIEESTRCPVSSGSEVPSSVLRFSVRASFYLRKATQKTRRETRDARHLES